MAYTLDDIKQTHAYFPSLSRQWDYLHRSYLGGREYREGAYLRKYLNEDSGPGNQYILRLLNTPNYNYCKNTIDVYRSFLFRVLPTRKLGELIEDPLVEEFIDDADKECRSLDAFMKTLSDRLQIFGSVWLAVDRPDYQAASTLEEIALGIRPYVTLFNPGRVMDWQYEYNFDGSSYLSMIKVIEESTPQFDIIKIWTPTTVTKVVVEKAKIAASANKDPLALGNDPNNQNNYSKIIKQEEIPNPLGSIPFINVITEPGLVKGTGVSYLNDVADITRSIYNKLSNLEQTIRISGHPTLVKTAETEAAAGAGAIITMPDNLMGDLKPYLLQPSSSSIDGIISAINADIKTIDEITHLGAVRATNGSPMSGVALQTEFQMLNSKLSDLATILEEAEERIWELYFQWQGMEWPEDFEIAYQKNFDLRDKHADLELFRKGLDILKGRNLLDFEAKILEQVAELILEDDEDIQEVCDEIENEEFAMGADINEAPPEGQNMAASPEPGEEDVPSQLGGSDM